MEMNTSTAIWTMIGVLGYVLGALLFRQFLLWALKEILSNQDKLGELLDSYENEIEKYKTGLVLRLSSPELLAIIGGVLWPIILTLSVPGIITVLFLHKEKKTGS